MNRRGRQRRDNVHGRQIGTDRRGRHRSAGAGLAVAKRIGGDGGERIAIEHAGDDRRPLHTEGHRRHRRGDRDTIGKELHAGDNRAGRGGGGGGIDRGRLTDGHRGGGRWRGDVD